MKIRTSSWHYRHIASTWEELPQALCWYFWKVVLTMLAMAAIGILMTTIVVFIVVMLTFPIWQFFINYEPQFQFSSGGIWLLVGGIILYNVRQWEYDTLRLKHPEPKPPGLVSSYIHAKHRKICPLLDYTNE